MKKKIFKTWRNILAEVGRNEMLGLYPEEVKKHLN